MRIKRAFMMRMYAVLGQATSHRERCFYCHFKAYIMDIAIGHGTKDILLQDIIDTFGIIGKPST